MREVWKFTGGQLVLRHEGVMFDKSTGKKNEWGRAIKILGGKSPITLEYETIAVLSAIMNDDEVMKWLGAGRQEKA